MKSLNQIVNFRLIALLFAAVAIVSCKNDDDAVPEEENEVEVITTVSVVFTNTADPTDIVTATAVDPDGEGAQELQVADEITLSPDADYTLSFIILNALDPADIEDIAEEIEEEDDEHQIFFSWTANSFADPTGNGNIDTASDPVNYNDQDDNGNPVGLSTDWTTGADTFTGRTFRVRLQHQPDIKTNSTGAQDGDTDFDLTFTLNVQ